MNRMNQTTADAADRRIETALVQGPVSVESFDWPADCGGECIFVGRTRAEAHAQLGPLIRLDYEVYRSMAEKVLRQMAQETAAAFDCSVVRLVHALGAVAPGQASVVIQVASPHRDAAFSACRALIERLKHDAPIWKREVWRDGETEVKGV